jgi:uncharacterized protein YecE (DUF72 family)
MAAKTGPDFRFVVKAPGELTHEGAPRPEGFAELRAALQPLLDAGKFGGVLAQFPWSFRPSEPARDLLQRVREGLSKSEALSFLQGARLHSAEAPSTFPDSPQNRVNVGAGCLAHFLLPAWLAPRF